jgi:uncharacterized integral membrane protein (TIGR00698 family)
MGDGLQADWVAAQAPPSTPATPSSQSALRCCGPGLAVAVAGAWLGWWVHRRVDSVSPHVVAVVVGVLIANTGIVGPLLRPGLRLAAKRVLRAGIVLVGVRLSLHDVLDLGPSALVSVVAVVAATFFGTQWLGRRLGLGHGMSMLVATGYSICGASAIAAAEPFSDAAEEEVAYSVALVTLCGSLAIVVLPSLGRWFGLDAETFGAWVGASVHDVGQVVAAASTRDSVAMSTAVVVKLTRVAMLAPLLAFVALSARQRAARGEGRAPDADAKRPPLLPLFVVLFLGAVVLRTVGAVPDGWLDGIKTLETLLLGAGLVGLGAAVDLRRLRALGGRPLVLGLVSWALVAGVSLLAVSLSF